MTVKMTYLQRNNRNRQNQKRRILIFIAIVIIALEFILHPIRSILTKVSTPAQSIGHGIGLAFEGFGALFTSKPHLQEENRLLKEEIEKLEIELERNSLYQEENKSLRKLLDIKEQSPNNIVAQVIAHPPATDYDTLLVRLGEKGSSVFEGMPVFYGEVYIGNVEKKEGDRALVRVVSSDTLSQEVYIGDKTVVLSGKGGGTFEVTVPKGFEIEVGQEISHVNYPTRVFAVVEHIETDEIQAVQKVYLRIPFSIHSIRYVNF